MDSKGWSDKSTSLVASITESRLTKTLAKTDKPDGHEQQRLAAVQPLLKRDGAARDAMALFDDCGPVQNERAHYLLTAAGVPEMPNIGDRLVWVAHRWLTLTHHPEHCRDKPCTAANALLRADHWYRSMK